MDHHGRRARELATPSLKAPRAPAQQNGKTRPHGHSRRELVPGHIPGLAGTRRVVRVDRSRKPPRGEQPPAVPAMPPVHCDGRVPACDEPGVECRVEERVLGVEEHEGRGSVQSTLVVQTPRIVVDLGTYPQVVGPQTTGHHHSKEHVGQPREGRRGGPTARRPPPKAQRSATRVKLARGDHHASGSWSHLHPDMASIGTDAGSTSTACCIPISGLISMKSLSVAPPNENANAWTAVTPLARSAAPITRTHSLVVVRGKEAAS